uniref:Frizzled-6 n=1 Tax=Ciona savignyi TaxID=51511 RepID=H2YBE8_CIOSA
YNYTTFPNILGHDNPTDASEVLFEYKLLLDSHCSTQLRFFLCSLHFPMCTPKVAVAIPACRGMCEKVRRECEPIMELGGVTWPESIDCSKLPLRHQKDRLCMGPPGESPDNPTEADNPPTITLDEAGQGLGDLGDESDENDRAAMYWAQHMDLNPSYVGESRREMLIPRNGQFEGCLPRCEKGVDVLFSSRHKEIAHWLLFGFSLLCFISTTVTVCTFMIDSKRFRYPERPIIFLSICYCAYSVAYLVRSANGPHHPIACVGGEGGSHFAKGGFQGSGCTAVFFVLYYFGMAASAWWVVLSLTWLLSAGFKWGHEAIEAYGFYFHLAAWLIPAVQTISALVLGKVDGDELTGVCYIGNLDPESLMYFVIIPLTFYLLTGTVALVFGFGYLFKIRRVIRHQAGKAAGKLEKLMMRIGVFSVLYTVPAACVVAVNFYQYQNFAVWMAHAERIPCKGATAKLDCSLSESIPSLPIFGIKIFMSLIAGITSGMWIWSGKTLESWRKFYESC